MAEMRTVEAIAKELSVKPDGISTYLLNHPEIVATDVDGIAHYPLSNYIIEDILGLAPAKHEECDSIIGIHHHTVREGNSGTIYELAEPVLNPQIPEDLEHIKKDGLIREANRATFDSISGLIPGCTGSGETNQNELKVLEAIKKYLTILDQAYTERTAFAFHIGYFFTPFDLMVRSNYMITEYESLEKGRLPIMDTEIASWISHGIQDKAPNKGVLTGPQLLFNPIVSESEFFSRCLDTYIVGKKMVYLLASQASCEVLAELREGLETKLERICEEIAKETKV